jgi:hypothetical protein
MKNFLIVDGYNIINAWDILRELRETNLEAARDKLIEILLNFVGYSGYQLILVFDAHEVKGGQRHIESRGSAQILYTKEGETADSVIERLSHELVEEGQRVYVATSDWAQQRIIFGKGAYRKSARELWLEISEANDKMKREYVENPLERRRSMLLNRIDDAVREKLEKIRRQE